MWITRASLEPGTGCGGRAKMPYAFTGGTEMSDVHSPHLTILRGGDPGKDASSKLKATPDGAKLLSSLGWITDGLDFSVLLTPADVP